MAALKWNFGQCFQTKIFKVISLLSNSKPVQLEVLHSAEKAFYTIRLQFALILNNDKFLDVQLTISDKLLTTSMLIIWVLTRVKIKSEETTLIAVVLTYFLPHVFSVESK